jgi:hypothetical protein
MAGNRFQNAVAVPVSEKQQTAVALLVPAAGRGRLHQLFDFVAGEVLSVGFYGFCCLSHFVESSPYPKYQKPLQTGQGLF